MSKYVLGINPGIMGLNFHDTSAVLLGPNGEIWAVEEERFCRIKGAPGIFPINSISWCLEAAGISMKDISCIAIPYDPQEISRRLGPEISNSLAYSGLTKMRQYILEGHELSFIEIRQNLLTALSSLINISQRYCSYSSTSLIAALASEIAVFGHMPTIRFFSHHLCHAKSAHMLLSFEPCLALVVDGVGEVACASVWLMENNKHTLLAEVLMPNSLGYFYAAATSFLGWRPWRDEGKLMALASYGSESIDLRRSLNQIIKITENGWDVSFLIDGLLYNGFMLDNRKAIERLAEITGLSPKPSDPFNSEVYCDFAFEIQNFLEQAVINFAKYWINKTGINKLIASGGVFLNCKLNMKIRSLPEVSEFHPQPVARDSGLALGAALLAQEESQILYSLPHLNLGPSFSKKEVLHILNNLGINYYIPDNIAEEVSSRIINGQIGFWFYGNAEFGPRALGARSIIADPRSTEVAEFINRYIKGREIWRPFACSILEEYAPEILINYDTPAPYMIMAYEVSPVWRERIPAVVHVDGTTRPQTVSRKILAEYYNIIDAFYKKTGIPLILNTSLNGPNQPLVCMPEEAIALFFSKPADFMVIEGIMIAKKPISFKRFR